MARAWDRELRVFVDDSAIGPRPPVAPYDAGMRSTGGPRKRAAVGVRDHGIVQVSDSWQNLTTGMGDPMRDKLLMGSFMPLCALDYAQLESLYYGDDMAELIVDALPDECFREGFDLEGPAAEEAKAKLGELDAASGETEATWTSKLRDGHGWGRLWGGAALILGIDDGQQQDQPLVLDRVKGVKFINVVDRRYIAPITYYENAYSPKFGHPEKYTVTPAFGGPTTAMGVTLHETRLIKFYGTRIDQITTRRLAGWSYSALQRPYDVLRLFAQAYAAAAQLANDAGQAIFKVSNLITQLAGNQKDAILQRFQSLDMQRWAGRMILVDKDKEDFAREPVQVNGVDKLLEHFEMRLAAAARMPVTMLMGRSPAGMDATGESDEAIWHKRVKAEQTKTLEPRIVRLLDIVTAGKWSKDVANKIVWKGLAEPNDKEEAEVAKLEAETENLYVGMGAKSGEQVALTKFLDKPIEEVFDEEALEEIVEADYDLAKNPPAPAPAPAAGAPLNGKAGGQNAPPPGGQEPPPPGRG